MLARVLSGTVCGVTGTAVCVETDVSPGLQSFQIVGLPEAAVRESRLRVQSALRNSGFSVPRGRITVNLAPAELPKTGALLDLPIAISVLVASGQLVADWIQNKGFIGELGLNGELRPGRGLLPIAAMGIQKEWSLIVVPVQAEEPCQLLPREQITLAASLVDVVEKLRPCAGCEAPEPEEDPVSWPETISRSDDSGSDELDMSDVLGQTLGKRVALIAAAGGHNILFSGPPGCGKSMLAERIPGLMPRMTANEALESLLIRNVAEVGLNTSTDCMSRPFRSPHHSATMAAMVGGGSPIQPGEISLAHHGVLFLDELPEFSRGVLESLRQPIESGYIHLSRARGRVTIPASFLLVAAMNPCPCGNWGVKGRVCECPEEVVQRYRRKLSGPILDRIDLCCSLSRVDFQSFSAAGPPPTTLELRTRVNRVHQLRKQRAEMTGAQTVSASPRELFTQASLSAGALNLVQWAMEHGELSGRGVVRLLRVARTIADLENSEAIDEMHVGEALAYRFSAQMKSIKRINY